MTNLHKTLNAALTGTAFMSLYSYSLSRKEKSQYREPELLEEMTHRVLPQLETSRSKAALGFGIHYLTGIGFTGMFQLLWKKNLLKPGWKSGSLLGALSGVLGIGMWEGAFRVHPNPPQVNKKHFFRQLIIAHSIFGATAGAQWKWLERSY